MLIFVKPSLVKLFFGCIASEPTLFDTLEKKIIRRWGEIDFTSPLIDFNFTDYYASEMGPKLKRKFFSLKKLIKSEEIVKIKIAAVQLERSFATNGKRRLNIDPGYLTTAKIVLSTTKDFSHRIYLGKGIFCEVTMVYQKKEWKNLPWTFPDYQTEPYKNFFYACRTLYKNAFG